VRRVPEPSSHEGQLPERCRYVAFLPNFIDRLREEVSSLAADHLIHWLTTD